jgi:hypothetical protein
MREWLSYVLIAAALSVTPFRPAAVLAADGPGSAPSTRCGVGSRAAAGR